MINNRKSSLDNHIHWQLVDIFSYLINLFVYSSNVVGFPLYLLWLFLFIKHSYSYFGFQLINVEKNAVGSIPRRLNECDNERLERLMDVIGHASGYFLRIHLIQSSFYRMLNILLMFILYQRIVHSNSID